jgi:hypothetical protein
MRSRTRLAGGLVVASAAFLAVLITAHPANRGVLAALVRPGAPENGYCGAEYYGECGDLYYRDGTYRDGYYQDYYQDGYYYGSGLTLQLSPAQAAPGDPVTVTGGGYTACTDRSNGTWVLLSVAGNSAVASGSAGSFSKTFTVPANAAAGTYTVDAACYSPSRHAVSSPVLRRAVLTVSVKGGPGSGPNGGPPGPAPSNNGVLIGTLSGAAGGAGLAFLAFLLVRASHRRHDGRWVQEHLRALAVPSSSPPSAEIRPRTGARSVSLGLQPHGGIAGTARIEEVGP